MTVGFKGAFGKPGCCCSVHIIFGLLEAILDFGDFGNLFRVYRREMLDKVSIFQNLAIYSSYMSSSKQ